MSNPTVLEICAGAGGQSLGLEDAEFDHVAAIDNDADACTTLKRNRPNWVVIEDDVANVQGRTFEGVELLAGGVPCPPFSIAGKQLGQDDERDLFPQALRIAQESRPRAILLENVRGIASNRFASYRHSIFAALWDLGYRSEGKLLNASTFGVPQLRPRFVIVALRKELWPYFSWPQSHQSPPTVGETIKDLMGANGWQGVVEWAANANGIAPTIVGGSKKHGGPDLGPTRARREWLTLRVDGRGIADSAPPADAPADLIPKLTLRMVARLQGFADEWLFSGAKTAAYRQVGNAFPPPVATAVAKAIRFALERRPHTAAVSCSEALQTPPS
jgi:DNA (cytosine-5)-methyltransferase 1